MKSDLYYTNILAWQVTRISNKTGKKPGSGFFSFCPCATHGGVKVQLLVWDVKRCCWLLETAQSCKCFIYRYSYVTPVTQVFFTTSIWRESSAFCGTEVVEVGLGPRGWNQRVVHLMRFSVKKKKNAQTLLKGRQQVVLKIMWRDPYRGWDTVSTILKTSLLPAFFFFFFPSRTMSSSVQCLSSSRKIYNNLRLHYVKCYTHTVFGFFFCLFFYKSKWLLKHTVSHLYKKRREKVTKRCKKKRKTVLFLPIKSFTE